MVSHLGLPQIRTCGTTAYGSSVHGLAAPASLPGGVSLRWLSSPMSRSSFPPPIPCSGPAFPPQVPRVSSPASAVLRGAPTPRRPSRLASLPSLNGTEVGSCFAPAAGGTGPPGPGLGHPVPVRVHFGGVGASQVPGRPRCAHAPLPDPGGIAAPRPPRACDAAFRCCDGVGFHVCQLSGLTHAACALPVYASQCRLPVHHATLGSGWWPTFTGRDSRPAGTH